MINLTDKNIRMELMEKYLSADTTPAEERALAAYYLTHDDVDANEQAFARLIRMEHAGDALLSTEGASEYDRLVASSRGNAVRQSALPSPSRLRALPWRWVASLGGIAACLALAFALHSRPREQEVTDMVQSLQQLIDLNQGDGTSIKATPVGENVWVEVEFADGTRKTFIMNQDKAMNTTSFMAIN